MLCCVVIRVLLLTLDFFNPHLCKNCFYWKIQDKRQGLRQRHRQRQLEMARDGEEGREGKETEVEVDELTFVLDALCFL